MAVGSIYTAKNLTESYQPLLLVVFTLKDSAASPTVLRTCTHGLNSGDGGFVPSGISGFPHNGQSFLARIKNQELALTQALSEQGIDVTPSVSIDLIDNDKTIWNTYERPIGLKGAKMEMFLLFWNIGANDFSTDYLLIFSGTCGPGQANDRVVSVQAISRLNMNQIYLPAVRFQKRCPWVFPDTTGMTLIEATARQQEAADDPSSNFWNCGYSRVAVGANARGNEDISDVLLPYFKSCNYTLPNCIERLGDDALVWPSFAPVEKDKDGRRTGRYGGSQWDPPSKFKSRGFADKAWIDGFNAVNEAKYGDYVPMGWGTYWIDPVIVNIVGDANITRFEAVVGIGEFSNIRKVIVNDIEVDPTSSDPEVLRAQIAQQLRWAPVGSGDRTGSVNGDTLYDGKGDVYGGLKCISVTIPRQLSPSSSYPRVRCLVDGPKVRAYSDLVTYFDLFTTNPSWIMMDALVWCGRKYEELNIQAFIDIAQYYDTGINFKTIYGGTGTHARFKLGFGIRQRITGSDLIKQIRTASQSYLIPDNSGKLGMFAKRTLAEEQPVPVTGSNYNTAVKSKIADGTVTNGFVAWKFDYSSVLQKQGGDSSLSLEQLSIQNTPNKVTIKFIDEENGYQSDSITLVDAEDVGRAGTEVGGQIPIEGIQSFDQGRRVIARWMAENFRGNNRSWQGDTGGTFVARITSSFKCLHLRIGHIVLVAYGQLNLNAGLESPAATPIDGFLARVIAVKPSTNFETVEVTISYHNDEWYLDTYGQEDPAPHKGLKRDRLTRPALPWLPWFTQPVADNPLWPPTEWGFGIRQIYETGAGLDPLPRVDIAGKLPIDGFAGNGLRPPSLAVQGTTSPTGGTIKAGRKYFALVCAKDTAGDITPPSDPDAACEIDVPAGADTATITIPINQWGENTTDYEAFAGPLRNKLSNQQTGAVTPTDTPASITLTDLNIATWGLPDVEFDTMEVCLKRTQHAGLFGIEVLAATATTIQVSLFSDNQFTAGQFNPVSGKPYYLTLYGLKNNFQYLPIIDWEVASNTGDVFTLAGGAIDPTAIDRGDGTTGLQVHDVVVISMRPVVGQDAGGNYIEDTNWVNAGNPLLTKHQVDDATNASPIVITTVDAHFLLTGQKVFISNVMGNTAANGVRYVNVLSPTTFELFSDAGLGTPVAGSGDYSGSSAGTSQRQSEGMNVDEEKGRELVFIRGTGTNIYYKIKSNTKNRIYIEGDWDVTPDATSIPIVNDPEWKVVAPSSPYNNTRNDTPVNFAMDVPNYSGQIVFAQAFTKDGGGNKSFRALTPFRMIYIYGSTGEIADGEKATFMLAQGAPVVAATRVAQYTVVTEQAVLIKAYIFALSPPTTDDLIVDIRLNGISIFGVTKLILPIGFPIGDSVTRVDFALPEIQIVEGDQITADIVQIDGTTQDITVILKFRKLVLAP